jgi:adenosylcobinamide kinase/adenosylcobinamide-phosphate guanylyltransferase
MGNGVLGRRIAAMVARSATAETAVASLPPITLVLGGARSGKSAYAEGLIVPGAGTPGLYLATAAAGDAEMAARIAHHRARRGAAWTTLEEPLALADALSRHARADRPILVDCLTLWVSNLMHAGHDVAAATEALVAALPTLAGPVVFVSNEVGNGIVPDNALARQFRDAAGRLNQAVAAAAQCVVLVTAGLPLVLKG